MDGANHPPPSRFRADLELAAPFGRTDAAAAGGSPIPAWETVRFPRQGPEKLFSGRENLYRFSAFLLSFRRDPYRFRRKRYGFREFLSSFWPKPYSFWESLYRFREFPLRSWAKPYSVWAKPYRVREFLLRF
jgi:hypothetical protein